VSNYDIVCLQEVFTSKWSSRYRDVIERCLPQYYTAFCPTPSFWSGHLIDGGLIVLSKFPIMHTAFHPFKSNPNAMRIADKGFLHVSIDVPTLLRPLHVINTHLHPNEGNLWFTSASGVRARQVRQISEVIYALADDPILLIGDFNIDASRGTEFALFWRYIDFDYCTELTEHTTHNRLAFATHSTNVACDFALCNQYALSKASVVVDHVLSDHYAVEFMLDVSATRPL
jgi:endonuclease/exonuclease/phosphatase family metal-dependent hydrolase